MNPANLKIQARAVAGITADLFRPDVADIGHRIGLDLRGAQSRQGGKNSGNDKSFHRFILSFLLTDMGQTRAIGKGGRGILAVAGRPLRGFKGGKTRADMVLLDIKDVVKTFPGPGTSGAGPVLKGVSLTLDKGQTLALTGESGSGKSTLLQLAGALDGFDSGEITLLGTPLSGLSDKGRAALRREIVALVFQQFNLIASLTVADNLAFHARMGGVYDAAWISRLTQHLGLRDLVGRYPEHLSGGQQQRVAIGRAMALRPRLLLADEPTGNLDQATGDAVLDLMLDLVAETGTALLLVTHSPRIAGRLERGVHLSGGVITDPSTRPVTGSESSSQASSEAISAAPSLAGPGR